MVFWCCFLRYVKLYYFFVTWNIVSPSLLVYIIAFTVKLYHLSRDSYLYKLVHQILLLMYQLQVILMIDMDPVCIDSSFYITYAAKCCLQGTKNSFKSGAIIFFQWWPLEEIIQWEPLSISPSHLWWISHHRGWWCSCGQWGPTQWNKFCCKATPVSSNAATASRVF